ncbi:hypothetical protein EVAR_38785_1 [Eumeta japonica]|uniref:Uncharacterized protein n=1 Tax=Eumeta variegata TaxID=151549 RepID=A0A4C1WJH7_EUMVA|nr:hypothetical protein EVAR_38785_1 [Eumeta japonica]
MHLTNNCIAACKHYALRTDPLCVLRHGHVRRCVRVRRMRNRTRHRLQPTVDRFDWSRSALEYAPRLTTVLTLELRDAETLYTVNRITTTIYSAS